MHIYFHHIRSISEAHFRTTSLLHDCNRLVINWCKCSSEFPVLTGNKTVYMQRNVLFYQVYWNGTHQARAPFLRQICMRSTGGVRVRRVRLYRARFLSRGTSANETKGTRYVGGAGLRLFLNHASPLSLETLMPWNNPCSMFIPIYIMRLYKRIRAN